MATMTGGAAPTSAGNARRMMEASGGGSSSPSSGVTPLSGEITPPSGVSATDIAAAIAAAVSAATKPLSTTLQTVLAGQNTATAQAAADKITQQTNWIKMGQSILDQYGIGALGAKYIDMIQNQGYDNSTALLALQSTPEWKQRFPANEIRAKQGLPVLDPATYLATEEAYKAVMIDAGLSPSVYNDTSRLGDLMAKDVSPAELKQRTDAAYSALYEKDPFVIRELQSRFGMTPGDMVLQMTDPTVAAPIIAQKVKSALIGAEADRQGLSVGIGQADMLAAQGVTQSQAQNVFGQIGQEGQFTQNLPGDTSGALTQQQLLDASFNGGDALSQLNRVRGARIAQFNEGGQMAQDAKGIVGLGSAATP